MNKQIVNAQTGEQSVRPFTPEEVAAVEAYKRDVFPLELQKEVEASRAAAYRLEADPLFFKSQRGESTTAEWEAKVAEIKARYPYPDEA